MRPLRLGSPGQGRGSPMVMRKLWGRSDGSARRRQDISHTFVEMAAKKAAEASVQVDFRQGTASKMPFASNVFDFLLCRAAFKNFAEPVRASQEMCRVLKPGGRGLIIDLRHDASPESIDRHVDGMGLSAVNRLLTKLTFRTMLLKSAYTKEQFQYMLSQSAKPPATSH